MKYAIQARHVAFGTVCFIIEAAERKEAFSKFKSIVHSVRQWTIMQNEEAGAEALAATTPILAPLKPAPPMLHLDEEFENWGNR